MKKLINISLQMLLILCASKVTAGSAIISGCYPSLKDGDVVELTTTLYGDPDFTGFEKVYDTKVKNHAFRLVIAVTNSHVKIFVKFKDRFGRLSGTNAYLSKRINAYCLEENDDITIREKGNGILFSGRGSEKFRVLQEINRSEKEAFSGLITSFIENPWLHLTILRAVIVKNLNYLERQKNGLSANCYILFKANICGQWIGRFKDIRVMPDSAKRQVTNEYKRNIVKEPFTEEDINTLNASPAVIYADIYTRGIQSRYEFDSCYLVNKQFSDHKYYDFLKRNYHGKLLERLVTDILFRDKVEPGDNSDLIDDAQKWVSNPDFKTVLQNLKSHRAPGARAFDFSLCDENGQMHKMKEFRGKVVFMDFWFTGCGNCIRVTPYIEKLEDHFRGMQVVFLSINVDNSKQAWIKSLSSGKYTTKSGLNLFSGGKGLNSAIAHYYSVDGGPTLILIDKFGKMMAIPRDPRSDDGRNITKLINEQLQ